nr:MAG TPA: hypothetical protein [Caudoviricetes sp.]
MQPFAPYILSLCKQMAWLPPCFFQFDKPPLFRYCVSKARCLL